VRYLVYGTGAVGGLLGGRLALDGQQVVFLARERIAGAMRAGGLRLGPEPGLHLPAPFVSVTLPQALKDWQPELVLLTVKAYDVESAASELARNLAADIPVVSFLNGIGNEEILADSLGKGRIIPATLTTSVQMVAPGQIRIEKERGIGVGGGHAALSQLSTELQAAGFTVRRYQDPARMKWSKLMTNIVANASSAILGWEAGQVFSHPGLARIEIEALRETLRAMRSLGLEPVDLPGVRVSLLGRGLGLPPQALRLILKQVVTSGRGKKKPSLHHDIGRLRSEVGWLNGAVVQVDPARAPANRLLLDVMQQLVADASAAENYRDPSVLLSMAAAYGVPGIVASRA
jgi:2-dehydropantoate 2-reductase